MLEQLDDEAEPERHKYHAVLELVMIEQPAEIRKGLWLVLNGLCI